MKLSDKTKIILYTIISTLTYLIGFIGVLSVISSRTATGQSLIPTFLFLLCYPFLQNYISKQLKASGNHQAASGIRYSILIEVLLLFVGLVYLSQMGK